jgi:hypothetical protein
MATRLAKHAEAYFVYNLRYFYTKTWPAISVGITTLYGLDGPGIESRWRRGFPRLSRPALGPTKHNGYRIFPGGKERPGRDANPSPLLVPWSRKSRIIPLLPYGPYGLYRASVPVQYSYTSTPLRAVRPV